MSEDDRRMAFKAVYALIEMCGTGSRRELRDLLRVEDNLGMVPRKNRGVAGRWFDVTQALWELHDRMAAEVSP